MISPSSIVLMTTPQVVIGRAAVVPGRDPAGRNLVSLRDLVLNPDLKIAVTEHELVQGKRFSDAVVPFVIATVDVIAEALAVDPGGSGRVAA